MLTSGRTSKNVSRTSFDEELKVAAEIVVKTEKVIDVTPAASGPLQSEAESAFQMLKVAMREYCLSRILFSMN